MDLISRAEQRPIEWRDIAFKERRYAYREKFYCRALKEVFPELSVAGIKEWNARQVLMAYGREIKEIEQKAELLLGNYTVEQAYQDFSLKLGNVNLVEFDEMLIQSGRLRIQHGKKNGAVIYPRLLNRLNFLRGILERSTKPLSSRKIHTEFKAMHIVHGFKNYPGVRRIHSLLSETPGIFYFGKSTFGLEKHLHVNCTHWPTLVREFEGYLRQNQKPTSTNEFLKFHREWGDELTAQELADILRQVGGLTDLGRQLFALPEWRLSKREKIVDIIRQALTSASTPLSEEHLIEAVSGLNPSTGGGGGGGKQTSSSKTAVRNKSGEQGGDQRKRNPRFPTVLISGQDPDPLAMDSSTSFDCDPRHPAIYQRPQDVTAGVYWINTSRPLAEKILQRNSADSPRWREYVFQRYVDIILREAIYLLGKEEPTLTPDDISRKVDDVTTKIHDQAAQDLDRFLFDEKFSA
jgi:hypothetical protein